MDLTWISPEIADGLGMIIHIMWIFGSWGFGTWIAFHLFLRFSCMLPEVVIQLWSWTLGFILGVMFTLMFRVIFPKPELPPQFQSTLFSEDFFSVWAAVASGNLARVFLLVTWVILMVIGLRFGLQKMRNAHLF